MSDTDTKVRNLLRDLGDEAPTDPILSPDLRRRVTRRRAWNVALAGAVVAAVVAGSVFGIGAAMRVRASSTLRPASGSGTEATATPEPSGTPDVQASPYSELKAEVAAMRRHLAALQAAQQAADEEDVRRFIDTFMRLRLIGAPDAIDFLSMNAKAQYDDASSGLSLYDEAHGGREGVVYTSWQITEVRKADANSYEVFGSIEVESGSFTEGFAVGPGVDSNGERQPLVIRAVLGAP